MDLKIAANDEQVNTFPFVDFTGLLDGGINSVESAMTLCLRQLGTIVVRQNPYATLNCNAHLVVCPIVI